MQRKNRQFQYLKSAPKQGVVQHQLFVQTENVNSKSTVKFLFANHNIYNICCGGVSL